MNGKSPWDAGTNMAPGQHGSPNVLIAYEDFNAGVRAKLVFDRVLERLKEEAGFNVHFFDLALLEDPLARAELDKVADSAVVTLLVFQSGGTGWLTAKRWMEQRAEQERTLPTALTVIMDTETEDATDVGQVTAEFEKLATDAGITIFTHLLTTPLVEHPVSRDRFSYRTRSSGPMMDIPFKFRGLDSSRQKFFDDSGID